MAAHGLSQEQTEEYRTVFAFYDKENKGSLDRATAQALMRTLGEDPSDADLNSLCPGGNMTVDSLLSNRAAKWSQVQTRQEVLLAFKVFDNTKSGRVQADVLKHALTTLGGMQASEADQLIQDANAQGGTIDYTAFVTRMLTGAN
jgi:calmodulin